MTSLPDPARSALWFSCCRARHLDWRVGDPAGAELEEVRRVRDDIARRVELLAAQLLEGARAPGTPVAAE